MAAHEFHFFVETPVATGDTVELSEPDRHHLQVVRARDGATITVADANGAVHESTLTDVRTGTVEIGVVRTRPRLHRVEVELLACVIESGRRWDDLLDQAVQAGVDRIVPVHANDHERRVAGKRYERALRVIEAAAKQSKRAHRASLAEPLALADAEPGGCGLLLEPDTDEQLVAVAQRVLATATAGATVRLLIGSPAGISPADTTDLIARGWIPAGMGRTILRSELAAAAATLTLVQAAAEWGP